jgi:CSLREA domain-containing protein
MMFFLRNLFHLWIALLLLWPTMGVVAAPRASMILYVNTTADDFTDNGNCTLREAIQAANTGTSVDQCEGDPDTQTIVLEGGVYLLALPGALEDENATGDLDITRNIEIVGKGEDETILDGGGLDRIFDIRSESAVVLIRKMTLQNGKTGQNEPDPGGAVANRGDLTMDHVRLQDNQTNSFTGEHGGGVANFGALTVTHSAFIHNVSDTFGGGLSNMGTLTLIDATFDNNYARGGAAIYAAGTATNTIRNVTFRNNFCGPALSSGIFQEEGSSMSIKNSLFDDNGDCDYEVISNTGDMTIRYTTFRNNNGGDGGIINNYGGSLAFSHSLMENNVNRYTAGQINIVAGQVTLDRLTITGGEGPALLVLGGDVKFANSTITGMTNSHCASAVCVNNGSLNMDSVTIANNQGVDQGSLVVTGGSVLVHNSILYNSLDSSGSPTADCSLADDTTSSRGYNLISAADGGCNWDAHTGDLTGALDAPLDPRLDALADNGGPSPTMALLPDSPAIDAGDPDPEKALSTDQRVYPRPVGAAEDIGAFEFGAEGQP